MCHLGIDGRIGRPYKSGVVFIFATIARFAFHLTISSRVFLVCGCSGSERRKVRRRSKLKRETIRVKLMATTSRRRREESLFFLRKALDLVQGRRGGGARGLNGKRRLGRLATNLPLGTISISWKPFLLGFTRTSRSTRNFIQLRI